LILVFGAFLTIVGITATAQAVMISAHFSAAALNDVLGSDSATTRAFVNAYVRPSDLETGAQPSAGRLSTLERQLATLVRPGEIHRVELRLPDGTILVANEPSLRGVPVPADDDFSLAASGAPRAAMVDASAAGAGPGALAAQTLVREFLPVSTDGRVAGVVGIWRDAGPIVERLVGVRRDVVLVTLTAALVAALVLFLVFRSANGRLARQTDALVEATRRDALTGTLNHGSLVAHLAAEVERAREAGTPLGIALIDLDNFRLLNDTHGHAVGDRVLLEVVAILRRAVPDDVVMGRYGPDEFLLIAPPRAVAALEPTVGRLRTELADFGLQLETTEPLPVTVSAGLCTYPEHGSSVTVLLSTAARTLEEAKSGGGDAIRVAGLTADGPTATRFDVLQGLVLAIDTKDRYTKRHSEDVARYAVFLAQQLGLEPELLAAIAQAGRLHDIGKIGIPDQILRKPGRLTAAEQAIVQQHVALGDMIVRDVPDIDVVRAGIRHHHERWDGEGYLDRLVGESIPLVARILAVGDAFSAMTTTRPYRKALDVREALRRLEDAAGTQLEARLVEAFVTGIETAEDAPLPGAPSLSNLWTPRVA
jgi:diguanylate cyclase (GGDEF)-like protein